MAGAGTGGACRGWHAVAAFQRRQADGRRGGWRHGYHDAGDGTRCNNNDDGRLGPSPDARVPG